MRGTETMKVGLKIPKVGTKVLISLVNPTLTLDWKQAIAIPRASTWASGRKISVRLPFCR
ncbi:Uncharacterised protein [Mycobacteroides abscessus subsp. abscessus]|nr:Uncharacterised protein [Mycobacteroides abscessus subsp. abscessus]SIM80660.1 Uncharacterised protein [Mycobacteroides abscessus subsp. abscessus]SKU83075.1 Uncharacterised protein [Mycobacteroides abscessus subsp. abscessus]SKU83553.1 Uncharacterised protein [Mycobacteroides abscessus subsp. abscessus]SKV89809.1 Uncharacterised protein [Mycobacteroides abscessus subsp. abscessus]